MNTISSTWSDVFSPADRSPIYDWASREVSLSPPFTKTGAFDVGCSRHFIAPLDALHDDRCREVNVLKPTRSGGTLLAAIWGPHTRAEDPGPFLFIMQTDPIADDYCVKYWRPTLESVEAIRNMLNELPRNKRMGQSIEFLDGNHYRICGPSLANLQSIGFRYEVQDECWMWPPGRIGQANARVGDYLKLGTSKILRISQGGPKEGIKLQDDDWYRTYNEATIHEWEIECPACHQYMLGSFTGTRPDGTYWGLTWDKHKSQTGDWNISRTLPTIRFECEYCRHPVIDSAKTKQEWNRTGRYRRMTEINPKKVSYHWEAVVDYPWDELVESWLNACNAFNRGNPTPKLDFFLKRRAMFQDVEGLLRGGMHLTKVEYDVSSDWPDELARYMTIDRQEQDVFWWTVRAWSRNKTRRLGFGRAFSFAELEKIRNDYKVRAGRTSCDSRFAPKGDNGVYAACARYNWQAVAGDNQHREFLHSKYVKTPVVKSYSEGRFVFAEIGPVGRFKGRCVLTYFAKNRMNAKVQELIDAGMWEEPTVSTNEEMDKEYAAQMASRIRRTDFDKKTNEVRVYWYEGKNDHARDLANQQVLRAMTDGILADPASEQLTRKEAKTPEPVAEEVSP